MEPQQLENPSRFPDKINWPLALGPEQPWRTDFQLVTPLTRSPGNRVLTLGKESCSKLGSTASGLQLFFWERCRDLSKATTP